MKDALAEKLLAHVLQWGPQEVARERPYLQAMAAYKYDEYQQFSPGMRFVESLACWLAQFATAEERRRAYEFVKHRLVFCSAAETNHLVESAYPDHVRPILLRRAAREIPVNERNVGRVAASSEFRVLQRQCLFLGLSDGARIDVFRRANSRELNHEQIWQTHELADSRVQEPLDKLGKDVGKFLQTGPVECKFRTVVLLDDFSASGSSYYSIKPNAAGLLDGKIAKFHQRLTTASDPVSRLVQLKDVELVILLYIATEQARDYLLTRSGEVWGSMGVAYSVEVVQLVPASARLTAGPGNPIADLIEQRYDHSVFNSHFEKGGTKDAKYGYAGCGLPVVLHHNTPNNSIFLLWSDEGRSVRGLFPRVQRHKETP
jgi:hypothetical protein